MLHRSATITEAMLTTDPFTRTYLKASQLDNPRPNKTTQKVERGRLNGHVPVSVRRGESPVKAGGKLVVIDGRFAKAHHARTGIAGYTLIHNSYGFLLASHLSFESTRTTIEEGAAIHSRTEILEQTVARMRIKDTDQGKRLHRRIDELRQLVQAYRDGLIKENGQTLSYSTDYRPLSF